MLIVVICAVTPIALYYALTGVMGIDHIVALIVCAFVFVVGSLPDGLRNIIWLARRDK